MAARAALDASRAVFWFSYLLNVLALSAITVLITSLPGSNPVSDISWLAGLTTAAVAWTCCFFVIGWLQLPRIHSHGPLARSLCISFRLVTSTLARAGACVVVLPLLLDALTDWTIGRLDAPKELYDPAAAGDWYPLGILVWLHTIPVIGFPVRPAVRRSAMARCEQCGYLLGPPSSLGQCPECGAALSSSCGGETSSRGCAWDHRRGFASWLDASWNCLTRPSRFYRAINLHELNRASHKFLLWQLLALSAASAAGLVCLALNQFAIGPTSFDLLGHTFAQRGLTAILSFIQVGTILFFFSWLYLSILGALIATGWMLRSSLPDLRWSARVIDYESVFLWPVWIGNVALAFAFLSEVVHFTSVFGKPAYYLGVGPELLYAFIIVVITSLVWSIRFRLARKAIQWRNF